MNFNTSLNRVEAEREARERYVQERLSTYREKGEYIRNRKFDFAKSHYDSIEKVASTAALILASGAFFGGIGCAVGSICGIPGGPPGVILGAAIGGGVGTTIGAALAVGGEVQDLAPRYKKWLNDEKGKRFAEELRVFLSDDEVLQPYTCGITLEPVIDAVRTPQGQLYERAAIVEHIQRRGNDPITREPLRIEDLVDDNDATLAASKRLNGLIEEYQGMTKKYAPKLLEGLQAKCDDLQERANRLYNAELTRLQKMFDKKEISSKEFRLRVQGLNEKYFG